MRRASVIVRSLNEAARLRLTLASLACQSVPVEVVVVNDGSSDGTPAVIAEAARRQPVSVIHHVSPVGRAASSNEGANIATGDILIFLDGDTLAGPDLVERHLQIHAARSDIVTRGETRHLRGVRMFLDPEIGTPMPGEEARVAAFSVAEIEARCVRREQIECDFPAVAKRAQIGVYPGAGPRRLYELHMEALAMSPECPVLWEAAAGSNLSVGRDAFLEVGGFVDAIEINAHREIALRLMLAGLGMVAALDANTYHMTHRRGWRDPLVDTSWEKAFYAIHPLPEVALLAVFWGSLADQPTPPEAARIRSLPELAAAAARLRGVTGIEAVRAAHFDLCGAGELAA